MYLSIIQTIKEKLEAEGLLSEAVDNALLEVDAQEEDRIITDIKKRIAEDKKFTDKFDDEIKVLELG